MATAVFQPRPLPRFPTRPEAQRRLGIAFVCVGNSCRSQMAEGWLRHLAGDTVAAVSAGLQPLGFITEETLQVMEEKKVSLAGQRSKGLEDVDWKQVDVLVNMTPFPGRSLVPGFQGRRYEWKVTDPYDRPLRTYRRVRDQLERKVRKLLEQLPPPPPPAGPAAPPLA